MIRRREFIAGFGGAAAWPLAARAQQGNRVRRIGVLLPLDENDPVLKAYVFAFAQALADLGWTDGRNVRIDVRWGGVDINRMRALAQELVGLQPDIIVTNGTPATVAVQRETRTIPIVFANAATPSLFIPIKFNIHILYSPNIARDFSFARAAPGADADELGTPTLHSSRRATSRSRCAMLNSFAPASIAASSSAAPT